MSRVIASLSISVDGFSAGDHQTEQRPFGDGGGDGIESALAQAREAAGGGDVSIQGGATTVTHVTYRVLS